MILVMTETLSLSAVKARLSELVDRVESEDDRIVVTRNGRPAAVIVSAEDLESLEETLAVPSVRAARSRRAGRTQPRAATREGGCCASLELPGRRGRSAPSRHASALRAR